MPHWPCLLVGTCFILLVSRAVLFAQDVPATQPVTIVIDASARRIPISPEMYGVFFEEINHAGDGGLYAELIQNRDMEAGVLPQGWRVEGEQLVTPAGWRTRKWFSSDLPGWSFISEGDAAGSMQLDSTDPINDRNPHSLKLTVEKLGDRCGIVNSGYWGMNIVKGEWYDVTLLAKSEGGRGIGMVFSLESEDGKVVCSRATLPEIGRRGRGGGGGGGGNETGEPYPNASGEWRRYTMGMLAMESHPKCRLVITPIEPCTMWLDVVSLFPRKTFKDRANGMRRDLAQMLVDLKPGFLRFPGGCVVEGATLNTRINWKDSIGDIAQRRGVYDLWHYYNTNGLGFHEFLQLAEDLGAEAMYVCNAGLSCQARTRQPTEFCTDQDLAKYVQEALDAIEYAIGPADSEWGAKRAANGRKEPFKLKYVEIGNENRGPEYLKRYKPFYDGIKARYPQIITIADVRMPEMPVEIVDDHFYRNPQTFFGMANHYNETPRSGPKVYVGEYAVNRNVGAGNLLGALSEAVFMLNMERNADLVIMCSYAPLFENVNDRAWPVNLIRFDSSRVVGRSSYHVQTLFAGHRPDFALQTEVQAPTVPLDAGQVQHVYALGGFDQKRRELVIKAVNPTPRPVSVQISLRGVANRASSATVLTLSHADANAENTLDNPKMIVPVESTMNVGGDAFAASLPANSLTVIRLAADLNAN
jgi:alpha-L-arabinofuranosidase